MSELLVSIVSPSMNYARYVGACLDSVRRQTHRNLEHLVLDAGSTDGALDVIRSYEGTYPLTLTVGKDRGQADALNKGFARARGDVLCWLNTDDYWLHDDVLARVVSIFREQPEIDVVTAGGQYVDGRDRPGSIIRADPAVVEAELSFYDTFLQPSTFWRRRVHRPLADDRSFTFDWQLFLGMTRDGARVRVIDEPWAAYRMHAVNKTAQDPARRRWEIAEVLKERWGPRSVRYLWARGVFRGFDVAERTGLRPIKSVVATLNTAMKHLTRRRVWSC